MPNSETDICRDYEAMVFDRRTTKDPRWVTLPNIDWADQPSRYKLYLSGDRLRLAARHTEPMSSLRSALERPTGPGQKLTPERLSKLLFYTNGILSRKMDLNCNGDNNMRLRIQGATESRGPASGGGMYPFEIYFVAGEGSAAPAGVYHYDNAHDTLIRLRSGDFTAAVRRASLGSPIADQATDFLLVTNIFWKTSFKYASLAYHIVGLDTGVCLGAAHLTARSLGVRLDSVLWFNDRALDEVIGVDPLFESVFAVAALRDPDRRPVDAAAAAEPPADHRSFQRSRRTVRFPLVEEVHVASFLKDEPRPQVASAYAAPAQIDGKARERVALPEPLWDRLNQPLDRMFRARRSSFGSMTSARETTLEELATILGAAVKAHTFGSDVKPAEGVLRWTGLQVLVRRVKGLEPAVYDYDPESHALLKRAAGPYGAGLQSMYFVNNYDLDQAAVAFLINGNLKGMFATYGNRGLRLLNAEVGSVCQCIYLACAALGLGCGALLGFDNTAMHAAIGLGSDENPLLLMAAGPEKLKPEAFRYRFD